MEITHTATRKVKLPKVTYLCGALQRKGNVTRHLLTIGSLPRVQKALAVTDPRVAADAI